MRHKLFLGIACMWLAAAPFAPAQVYPGYGNGNPVGRARMDLNRAGSDRWLNGHDRKHLFQAQRDLDRFDGNWSRGKFDKDRLDGAIGHIQQLVNSNRVNPRDRRILADDLFALRAFLANRGYRRGGYGYGPGPWGR